MNTIFNSGDKFNELLFENKNKAYGAYAIRNSEKDSIAVSLLITSAFFGLLVMLCFALTKTKIEIPTFEGNEPPIILSGPEIEMPKPLEQPKPPKAPETPKSTSGAFVASSDPQKTNVDANNNLPISKNPNPTGKDSAAPEGPVVKLPEAPEKLPEVVPYADIMPSLKNMAQFIADNLKYPRNAVGNGTEGTVFVTFVVERDGSITDIKLLKGIGDGCEQEAMRVVKMMPVWEPGTLKGVPKRVQCNLPIKFSLK